MQPGSHQLLLRRAVALSGSRFLEMHLADLLAGDRDEDSYRWPILGIRTPSIGLSHTHRPGRSRGELGFPSARTRCASLVRSAGHMSEQFPDRACRLLGRACHLLLDVAVPARTRGVWHYFGDPFERWVEAHLDQVESLAPAPVPAARDPETLVDSLAAISSKFPADTTRSLYGIARSWIGEETHVSEAEAGEQARAILPHALAHATSLLASDDRRVRSTFGNPDATGGCARRNSTQESSSSAFHKRVFAMRLRR